jgi:hypothetical protein
LDEAVGWDDSFEALLRAGAAFPKVDDKRIMTAANCLKKR